MTTPPIDIITEDIAVALSEMQSASRSVGELAHRPGEKRAEDEERQARAECETVIAERVNSLVAEIERLRHDRDDWMREASQTRAERNALQRLVGTTRKNLSDFTFNGMCPEAVQWEVDRIDAAYPKMEGA